MYTVSYKCEFTRIHKVGLMQLLLQTRNNKLNKIATVHLSDFSPLKKHKYATNLNIRFLKMLKVFKLPDHAVRFLISGHWITRIYFDELHWGFRSPCTIEFSHLHKCL